MFNFMNIDEIEFEEICKEILERKTGKSFKVFGRGADGGIDIQANDNPKIIGQVKLYINTPQSNTVNKIKSEINRIKYNEIEEYYIFIGREMSPQNIEEIYEEGKKIIKSKENIFTIKEINELLNKEEYMDIVRQHIKLWICATNILEQINNRNIFLDCEILLDNIKEDVNLFVQTDLYKICQEILDKDRLLLILGMPGIGKTMISKMLVLYYAQKGYSIRYSNSRNLDDLKKVLSLDRDRKELIFLDDCLGQRYLELHEHTENDIINLIKYVKKMDNKILLLNSRITIFQEAKTRKYEIGKCIDNRNLQIQVIDIEDISDLEKARIFHHYLLQKHLPEQYIKEIVKYDNYMKIIKNTSYSPRIIDYMTEEKIYSSIQPKDYVEAIQKAFEKSIFVWKDEYENKIDLQDRIFLTILFSISDYEVDENILKKAFYERLKMENIDTSIPVYERVLERLNESFIKIGIKDNKRVIFAINPSVNDFMKKELENNELEKQKILNCAISIEQVKRIANSQKEYDDFIKNKIIKNEFLQYNTNAKETIEEIYLAHLVYYDMIEKIEQIDLSKTILSLGYGYNVYNTYICHNEIMRKLWHSQVLPQKVREMLLDEKYLSKILHKEVLSEQIEFLQTIYEVYGNIKNEGDLIDYLKEEFKDEPKKYSVSELASDYGLDDIVMNEAQELKEEYEYDERWNEATEEGFKKELTERVEKSFYEVCIRNVYDILADLHCELPDALYDQMEFPEVESWSFDEKEMHEIVLKYISYVYNTYEEDYTYYKKYIYDGHLLNKSTEEEKIIKDLFLKS